MNLMECGKTVRSAAEAVLEKKKAEGKRNLVLIGIDGRSGAGKSTFAHYMESLYHIPVVHLEEFGLTAEDGNEGIQRILDEIIIPLEETGDVIADPARGDRSLNLEKVDIRQSEAVILEGAGAMLPELRSHYDLKYFITVSPESQKERIVEREGAENLQRFLGEVIPAEERYIAAHEVEKACNGVYDFHRD